MSAASGKAWQACPESKQLLQDAAAYARRGGGGKSRRSLEKSASYDDSGVTGEKSCWVLEAGAYGIYVGTDVRSAKKVCEVQLDELHVISRLEEALAPVQPYERLVPVETGKRAQTESRFWKSENRQRLCGVSIWQKESGLNARRQKPGIGDQAGS